MLSSAARSALCKNMERGSWGGAAVCRTTASSQSRTRSLFAPASVFLFDKNVSADDSSANVSAPRTKPRRCHVASFVAADAPDCDSSFPPHSSRRSQTKATDRSQQRAPFLSGDEATIWHLFGGRITPGDDCEREKNGGAYRGKISEAISPFHRVLLDAHIVRVWRVRKGHLKEHNFGEQRQPPPYVKRAKNGSVKYEQTFISLGEACVSRSMPRVNLKRVCSREKRFPYSGLETAITFLIRQGLRREEEGV